jgi:hypothetical protein
LKIIEWLKEKYKIILIIVFFVVLPIIIGRIMLDEYAIWLACWAAGIIPIAGLLYAFIIVKLFFYFIFKIYKTIRLLTANTK